MSTITTTPTQSSSPLASSGQGTSGVAAPSFNWGHPDLYRMTVDEYERIGGMLEDDRVELIDGYLVKKMSKKPPHISAVENVLQALTPLLPTGFFCRKEDPVRIPDFDEPEPDVSILRGSRQDYRGRLPEPGDVATVIEASETTLDRDQGPKLSAYAKTGIPVYWIVNLVDNQVEVYSNPGPGGYKSRQDFKPGQDVPVVIDGAEVGRIAVAAILP
jgi:Uma2 family endonuclease